MGSRPNIGKHGEMRADASWGLFPLSSDVWILSLVDEDVRATLSSLLDVKVAYALQQRIAEAVKIHAANIDGLRIQGPVPFQWGAFGSPGEAFVDGSSFGFPCRTE